MSESRVVDVRTGHKLMGCDWGRNEGHFRYRHEGRVFVRSSVQKRSRKQRGGGGVFLDEKNVCYLSPSAHKSPDQSRLKYLCIIRISSRAKSPSLLTRSS